MPQIVDLSYTVKNDRDSAQWSYDTPRLHLL